MKKLLNTFLFSFIIVLSGVNYSAPKPYVILISFDAFRWDYLNRGISKTLNDAAQNGVSALSLRPAFPSKTFPNHLSLITGMYPEHHGIISNNFPNPYLTKEPSKDNDKNFQSEPWYVMKDTASTREESWYLGEAFWETAERQGIITASYFWPGSNVTNKNRRPTYVEKYQSGRSDEDRIRKVEEWLSLPQEKRPHFLSLYFQDTDDAGHDFGPNSVEVNKAIQKLDTISAMLFNKLNDLKMKDSVDVIFVSDHGMTEISKQRMINIEKIVGDYKAKYFDDGPFMTVRPQGSDVNSIYQILKSNENHYKVYLREKLPSFYHYSENTFISPIVIIADLGWSLLTNKTQVGLSNDKGNHGYDNNELDMHGIFLATGPDFKKEYRTGTLWNIDLYPLLCKIFNIMPRSNIDGKLERIEFILK
jgi:ectonucleotide pyrophosphatase/phosphodiesterase family protein 5